MSINDDVELLRRIPMFAKVEPAKLKLLAFTSERVTYSEGQDLFRQGDNSDAAYIIVDGTADVVVNSPKGPLTVAQLGKNEFVGDIGILCDVPRTATVRAATRSSRSRSPRSCSSAWSPISRPWAWRSCACWPIAWKIRRSNCAKPCRGLLSCHFRDSE